MTQQLQNIQKQLKKELDKDRYEHTLGVMYTAGCLAMRHGCDMQRAMLAGLLHDCAKCVPNDKKLKLCKKNKVELTQTELDNPFLIHAKLGAFFAKSIYEVDDEEVLHAIKVHTTGAPNMNMLDKIVFIADYIEPNRYKAKNLMQVRTLAFEDLDRAAIQILKDTLTFLDSKADRSSIDPLTLETYNFYMNQSESLPGKEQSL